MLTLQALGGASIQGETGPLAGPASQRHRLALLALLASAHPAGVARDKLMALLWPESDTEHARNLLNQAVHVLRRAAGETSLLSAGDELRLDPGVLPADVIDFERALGDGDLERAVDLYRGPFLDGFFLPGSLEFERWVDGERNRLRKRYAEVLERLARKAGEEGDAAAAASWWRRLLAEDPLSSRITQALMLALEAAGERAEAIKQARVHSLLLEQQLGAEPDPAVTALAERMRTDPQADVGPPDRASPAAEHDAEARSAAPSESIGPGSIPPSRVARVEGRRRGLRALVALLVLGLAAAGGSLWIRGAAAPDGVAAGSAGSAGAVLPSAGAPSAPSIAVLAFDDMSPGGDQRWFADGIAEEILSALAGIEGLRVSARQSSFAFRDTPMDVRRIGDSLGVASVLEGSVRKGGDSVWVTAQLIDVPTGFHRWAETYATVPTGESLRTIQRNVAREVARALELQWRPEPSVNAPDEAGYQAYLQGRYHLRRAQTEAEQEPEDFAAEVLRSIELFRAVVAESPEWAPGWAALGEALHWAASGGLEPETRYPESKAALERALVLDPRLGAAHASLGFVLLNWELDFDGAEARYRHALALGDDGWAGYARLLYATGRFDEAVAAWQRAAVHDPLRIGIKIWLGRAMLCAGRFEDAIEHGERAFSMDRGPWGLWTLAQALERTGRVDEALARIDEEELRFGFAPGWKLARALLHARAGRPEAAESLLNEFLEARWPYPPPPSARHMHAAVLAALGEVEGAIDLLEELTTNQPLSLLFGHCYPEIRALEHEPRYREILRLAGLPER